MEETAATEMPSTKVAQTSALVAENFASWLDIVSKSFVPLQLQTDDEDSFKAQIRMRSIGDVFVSDIGAAPHRVERTPALIAEGQKKYFKLSLQLSGTSFLMQDNREAVLRPGDMAIYDTDRPYTLAFESDFRSLVVMVPQASIDIPRDVVGQITATRISGDQGIGEMVAPFLTQMTKNMDDLKGHSGVRLINNAIDLVTTMLLGELDCGQVVRVLTHRAGLLKEIRAYIDEHLSDPNLNPSLIAAANFISTRHLHGIFQAEGVTVSAWIRKLRLEHCKRDLADPVHLTKPVSAVAARWGFLDASHFSRLFRATFGETPSDYRSKIWTGAILH